MDADFEHRNANGEIEIHDGSDFDGCCLLEPEPSAQESVDKVTLSFAGHLRRDALLDTFARVDERQMDVEETFFHPFLDGTGLTLKEIPFSAQPTEEACLSDSDAVLGDQLGEVTDEDAVGRRDDRFCKVHQRTLSGQLPALLVDGLAGLPETTLQIVIVLCHHLFHHLGDTFLCLQELCPLHQGLLRNADGPLFDRLFGVLLKAFALRERALRAAW